MVPVDICGKKPVAFLQTIQGERSQNSLLTFSMHSEATGPSDRAYALLRLANDASRGNIPLDYSLSPCAMYCATILVVYDSI